MNRAIQLRYQKLRPTLRNIDPGLSSVQLGLFGLWLLSMIALPIIYFIWGTTALPGAVSLNVAMQAVLVLSLLYANWGAAKTTWAALAILLFTWAIEVIGSSTGLPFGLYHYTDTLQPQFGHVPLLIPLAWLIMLPPAWAVAYRVNQNRYGWRFVLLSGLAFTAWDLFIDPQMVGWGFWTWDQPGEYFGIPLINFLGWFLSGAVITAIIKPTHLPVFPLLLIYTIVCVLQMMGQLFFWHMPGPALVGFAVMGLLAWLAWTAPQPDNNRYKNSTLAIDNTNVENVKRKT